MKSDIPKVGRPKGQPKTGGRKKGTPNKTTAEIRDLAVLWTTSDPEWVQSVRERMKDGKAPHIETYLLQMAYGKPKERLEMSGDENKPLVFTLNLEAATGK